MLIVTVLIEESPYLYSRKNLAVIRGMQAKSILMDSKGQERVEKCGISNCNDI